ncbi:DgyrCDS4601 [Dimorphilus gyrociliatus]|uniref:DgyrCDS4601 n=1 Tax=Dimorphilus gyrociliatus TaxID=2664684 RepID=A0A7I8VIW7_9ANNE|nr:DgyrCDS4601 [Dimorphilus gyrociliatus]
MDTDEETYILESDKQRLNSRLVFAFFSCVIGSSFVFGVHTGVVNLPQTKIEQFLNETELHRTGHHMTQSKITLLWALIVSIWAIGGMIGGVNAGYFADKLGRKKGLLLNNILTFLAVILFGFSKLALSYEMLIVGRFIAGIQCGISTGIAPLYLSEVAPLKLRGAAGTLNQLAIVFGVLISQIIGMDFILGTDKLWPILLSFPVIAAILQLLTFSLCPESPKYLYINKNDRYAAIRALQWLRSGDSFEEELQDMQIQGESCENTEKMSICGIFTTKWLRRPIFISIIMQLSQQLSGINAVIYYSTQIFRKTAHLTQTASQFASIGVSVVNFIITAISASLVDKAGRRYLHLLGLGGMFCAACALTTSFLWEVNDKYILILSTVNIE